MQVIKGAVAHLLAAATAKHIDARGVVRHCGAVGEAGLWGGACGPQDAPVTRCHVIGVHVGVDGRAGVVLAAEEEELGPDLRDRVARPGHRDIAALSEELPLHEWR